jgi:hypothetical protein
MFALCVRRLVRKSRHDVSKLASLFATILQEQLPGVELGDQFQDELAVEGISSRCDLIQVGVVQRRSFEILAFSFHL